MNPVKRTLIRRTLLNLAESHAATIELMEQALSMLGDELAIDAVIFWKARSCLASHLPSYESFNVDRDRLQVVYHGRTCVLGNALPLKLLERLARRVPRLCEWTITNVNR